MANRRRRPTLAELEKELHATFDEIVHCLAQAFDMDLVTQKSELAQEAQACIDAWSEGPHLAGTEPTSKTPLAQMLSEYCDIEDAILDIRDARLKSTPGEDVEG